MWPHPAEHTYGHTFSAIFLFSLLFFGSIFLYIPMQTLVKNKKKINVMNARRSSDCKEKPTQASNPHLGFSWQGVLRGSADLWAFTLHGEAGGVAQRVLHHHTS